MNVSLLLNESVPSITAEVSRSFTSEFHVTVKNDACRPDCDGDLSLPVDQPQNTMDRF